jgi:hypothetical protein
VKVLAIGALALSLILMGGMWWQSGKVSTLQAETGLLKRNELVSKATIEHLALSAEVAAARAGLAAEQKAELDAKISKINDLVLGECADAEIDSDLADILGRVPRRAD